MYPADNNIALAVTRYRVVALKRPDSFKTMRLYQEIGKCVKALVRDLYREEGLEPPRRYR